MIKILDGPSFSVHKNPTKLIILLHGYGDNADNFIHLAQQIVAELENVKALFIAGR